MNNPLKSFKISFFCSKDFYIDKQEYNSCSLLNWGTSCAKYSLWHFSLPPGNTHTSAFSSTISREMSGDLHMFIHFIQCSSHFLILPTPLFSIIISALRMRIWSGSFRHYWESLQMPKIVLILMKSDTGNAQTPSSYAELIRHRSCTGQVHESLELCISSSISEWMLGDVHEKGFAAHTWGFNTWGGTLTNEYAPLKCRSFLCKHQPLNQLWFLPHHDFWGALLTLPNDSFDEFHQVLFCRQF